MRLRLLPPALILILSGCATTAVEPVAESTPATGSVWIAGLELPHGAGETIDDHLFIPAAEEVQAVAELVVEQHVHPHVWERLLHSFMLPECSEQEISRNWAQWDTNTNS